MHTSLTLWSTGKGRPRIACLPYRRSSLAFPHGHSLSDARRSGIR